MRDFQHFIYWISVPSPQDCWLRKQKIVLREEHIETEVALSTANAVTRKEIACQTQLTLPPQLPREVEAMLRKYNMLTDNDHDEMANTSDLAAGNSSMMNISTLRKKLFIQHTESPEIHDRSPCAVATVSLSPPPRTPDLKICDHDAASDVLNSAKFKVNSTSIDLFGELSPIQKLSPCELSPCNMSIDVSMRSNDKTPLRVLRKYPKKNLSESFCLMQEDDDGELEENEASIAQTFDEDKRNFHGNSSNGRIRFGRFDSGFANDDCSNDTMQFWDICNTWELCDRTRALFSNEENRKHFPHSSNMICIWAEQFEKIIFSWNNEKL